jgi:patatin-like phospholipase/acyl hydrolase
VNSESISSPEKNKPFRVLTLDGGGMRGLYTTNLLMALAKRFNHRFSRQEPDVGKTFNLICGTSTGAILACALAAGIPLSRIKDLYIKKGPQIFRHPMPKGKRCALWRWVSSFS